MARQSRRHHEEAVRITTAAPSRADDIAARQRRYVLSMGIRSACFVGAVLAALAGLEWVWPFLIFGALVLPYIAVVMANNAASRSDGFALQDRGDARPQLPAPPDQAPGSGREPG